MNKRGIFFTLLSIVILSIFVTSYIVISNTGGRENVENRVESLNQVVFSLEDDLPRQLFTSGFRIVFLMQNDIVQNGDYISNFDSLVQEAFFNASMDGENQSLMEGASYGEILESLQEKAGKVNANVSMSNPMFEISQEDPWNLRISLTVDFVVEDNTGLALWNKTEEFYSLIPVSNFNDPMYLVETNGVILHKVRKTVYDDFVNGSDVSNLNSHLQGGYYVASAAAPSFLGRLEGDFSSSENGVESLVNLQELSQQGINVKDKSVVDYIYFSGNDSGSCNVQPSGMPSWFKLDSGNLATYGVSCV